MLAILVAWVALLGWLLRPQTHPAPRISHTYRLDRQSPNLPTLAPFAPSHWDRSRGTSSSHSVSRLIDFTGGRRVFLHSTP